MTTLVELDSAFRALGNSTRRAVLEQLGRGPATIGELAEPFDMALPSFLQHVRALEDAGLVRSEKLGRVRTVHIVPDRFLPVAAWLREQRSLWTRRLDQLDSYLEKMENDA